MDKKQEYDKLNNNNSKNLNNSNLSQTNNKSSNMINNKSNIEMHQQQRNNISNMNNSNLNNQNMINLNNEPNFIELQNNNYIEDKPLTEFEQELKEAFNEFDKNLNGSIDREEFLNFMQKLGYRPTLVELQEMIDEIDKDGRGNITFDEFKLLMTRTIRDEFTCNSSIEAFEVFDQHKTGKIKKRELNNILLKQGEYPMTQTEVDELLKHVNFINDEINYSDFVKSTLDLFK